MTQVLNFLQAAGPIVGYLILGFVALKFIAFLGSYILRPAEHTVKAKTIDETHQQALAKIETEALVNKLKEIGRLPVASQLEALRVLRAEAMGRAKDWRVFGFGGGEGNFLHSGARTIAESDALFEQLKESPYWGQLWPLLEQLGQKAGFNFDRATAGAAKAASPAPSPKLAAVPPASVVAARTLSQLR
ncbi:hypothetical protein HY091_03300 [Candidatus Kaiserbacteria bacterium]|nr:hypothetical protein [Candidatus Kaiserbacteria bacterium]